MYRNWSISPWYRSDGQRRDKISLSLRSWRDSCARSTFLAGELPGPAWSERRSLPADVLWVSFVTHSHECVTNEPQRTSAGRLRAAKPRGKIPPATFLMSFECRPLLSAWLEPFDYPIRKSGVIRYWSDLQTSQAKRNNQVTDKTTTRCNLFRIQAGYSAVIPNFRS